MRLGIFGGSFDPVHYGHLLLAEMSREQLRLDRVVFVPAAQAPHKRGRVPASGTDRVDMLRAACDGRTDFEVSTAELERGGLSYTVDTLRHFHAAEPGAELYLVLGADSLADLPTWREPESICELALLAVTHRPGSPPLDYGPLAGLASPARIERFRRHEVTMPQLELSSSEIRRRIAGGESVHYQTPPAVIDLIASRGLYYVD